MWFIPLLPEMPNKMKFIASLHGIKTTGLLPRGSFRNDGTSRRYRTVMVTSSPAVRKRWTWREQEREIEMIARQRERERDCERCSEIKCNLIKNATSHIHVKLVHSLSKQNITGAEWRICNHKLKPDRSGFTQIIKVRAWKRAFLSWQQSDSWHHKVITLWMSDYLMSKWYKKYVESYFQRGIQVRLG